MKWLDTLSPPQRPICVTRRLGREKENALTFLWRGDWWEALRNKEGTYAFERFKHELKVHQQL